MSQLVRPVRTLSRCKERRGRLLGPSEEVRTVTRGGRRLVRPGERARSVSLVVKMLYTTSMTDESLPGGLTTGAVLIGDVVHKPTAPWTSTVHALLRHLEDVGFDDAPRALGFDDHGREMLTYLPGETVGDREPWPAWVWSDSTLIQVGRWLRRLHDATVSFVPPANERWFIGGTVQPGLIVGHQDAAPYNAVMDGDRLVGFCDWDTELDADVDRWNQGVRTLHLRFLDPCPPIRCGRGRVRR
jgi:hypothetical protein